MLAAAVVAGSIAAPVLSLVGLAAFLPVAPAAFAALLGWPGRWAEIIPAAVLFGTFARRAASPRNSTSPVPLGWPAVSVICVVVASVIVQVMLTRVELSPAGFDMEFAAFARAFYDRSIVFDYVIAAVRVLVVIALCVVVSVEARDPARAGRLVRAMLIGGIGVALLNIARLGMFVLRSGSPLHALPSALAHVRISAPHGDPNATGSYFALLLPVAVALAAGARGSSRVRGAIVAAVLATALWLSGSRAALGAALLTLAVIGARYRPRVRLQMWVAGAGAVCVIAAALWFFPNPVFDKGTLGATRIRAEMARVAVRLWKTDPLFGVGIGRFYDLSGPLIEDPFVRAVYSHENAHNNFLQLFAELGLLGAAACAWFLVTAFRAAPRHYAAVLGVVAFLLTCLFGHPLLIPDDAFAFALLLGVVAATAEASREPRWPRVFGGALILLSAASVPIGFTIERRHLSLEHIGYGLSLWQTAPEGDRYRVMDGVATVFVPSGADVMVVPFKCESNAALPVTVDLVLDGRLADRVALATPEWRRYHLMMPPTRTREFIPLRLIAADAAHNPARLMVGKAEALQRK
jgi:O-antigen ligase/polysaccharide polymerase Wzy-like membrane protein